ncbi:MAG TPA: carboxypeptidase-like regulatory domain-containing protein, partial [Thermoplasmata archaeon]|nr:carboxypeptidase-like regulatory domain-containing protein [Thermoplasmata archaeon]
MNGPSSPRRLPRNGAVRRPLLLAVVVAAAVLCGLPAMSLGTHGTFAVAAPHGADRAVVRGVPAPPGPPGSLAGTTPSGRVVDAPALFRAYHSETILAASANRSAPPVNGSPRAPVAPATVPTVRLASSASSGGWVAGTVVDSLYDTPLSGVYVSTFSGSGCTYCQVVTTNATGFFRVEADPGPTTVKFSLNLYVDNLTTATVTAGQVVSVGTVQMVHFATVYGVVAADLPGQPGLVNVTVTSVSRDFGLSGPDLNFTTSNGSFRFYVDPLPVEVDFTPSDPAYLTNLTDVATTPWQVLDMGTILLEGGVVATVHIVDAETGAAVALANGRYCSNRIDSACFPLLSDAGGTAGFDSVAGPGFLVVGAPGYVTNVTQVPAVPSGTAGPTSLGTVQLLPLGDIEVTVNFTGGVPNGTWPTGSGFDVVVCSLSGMYTSTGGVGEILPRSCVGTVGAVGQTILAAATPLRNVVYIDRCYLVPDGFPVAEYGGAPGGCPFPTPAANVTWANVTPDHSTYLGSFNAEAGTYLSGTIQLTGPSANSTTALVTLRACSTVRISECGPVVQTNSAGPIGSAAGCPGTAWAFCVPAPPGPDRLTASWGPLQNTTWVTVPRGCCAQQGHPLNVGRIGFDTDLGPSGTAFGQIAIAGDPPSIVPAGGWTATVTVCPALRSLQRCNTTGVDASTGTFSLQAPAGWDSVNVTASQFRPNGTWIDVVTNNSTGTIELTPFGAISGQVVSAATGDPILEAQVVICSLATQGCRPLGVESNSNGTFVFAVSTLAYPAGTFQVKVTAAGYDGESTFANVTAGATTALPRLRLPPIGLDPAGSGRLAPRGANSSTPTTGSWVTGRLVDRSDGLGAGLATILICQLLTSNSCSYSAGSTSTGGEFNLSTVHGA